MPKQSIVVVSVILIGFGCGVGGERPSKDLHRYTYKQLHMGVEARLVLYTPTQAGAQAGARAAFARLAQLDDSLSDYRPHSALNRLSARSGGPPVRVGQDLFRVLQAAQHLAAQTAGRFDVTVGPLTHLWREARRTGIPPAAAALAEARQRVGWQHMTLDSATQTIHLALRGMQLDLGGIAKGYAAGEVYQVLAQQRITQAMVEVGGDLYFGDPPPGQTGWTLQVPALSDPLTVARVYVATSGAEVQYLETEAGPMAHVIDIRTGQGHLSYPSVSVIAKQNPDGLATALGLLGKTEGQRFGASFYPEAKVYFWGPK